MTIYNQISSNKQKTYMIMALFVLLFTGVFFIAGLAFGDANMYLILGLIISVGSSFFSYFYSDKVVLATVQAHPATKEQYFDFYTVTENLAIASGIPMPKLYVIDDPSPNAFATGRNPDHAFVCATTGLLHIMDRAELEGVVAHELAHIKNYDILVMTVVSVLVGTLALVTDWILRGFWWRGNSDNKNRNPAILVIAIVAMVLSPIIATLIQLAISRRREFLADASGALLTRHPDGLARALEKIAAYPHGVHSATSSTSHLFIYNPLRAGEGVMSWFQKLYSTHPPVEERINILRSM